MCPFYPSCLFHFYRPTTNHPVCDSILLVASAFFSWTFVPACSVSGCRKQVLWTVSRPMIRNINRNFVESAQLISLVGGVLGQNLVHFYPHRLKDPKRSLSTRSSTARLPSLSFPTPPPSIHRHIPSHPSQIPPSIPAMPPPCEQVRNLITL